MRFLIRFSVDERAVGPVLAALNSHDGVVFEHLAIEPLIITKPVPAPKGEPPCQNDWARKLRPDPKHQTQRERRAERAAKKAADPQWPRPIPKSSPQTGRQIVLDLLADGASKTVAEVKAVLGGRGFAKGGISSLLEKMRLRGDLTRVSDGVWALAPKEA